MELMEHKTMPKDSIRSPEIFTALNGLRFVAALAVVFYHYARKMDGFAAFPGGIRSAIECGPTAVGFFFILSGFLLAHRYLENQSAKINVRSFYGARFARLYPAYMFAFLLFLPGAIDKYILHPPAVGTGGPGTFVLSATLYCLMLQAWTPLAQSWNGPSWSLSVEAFMYLIFPWIGYRLTKLSNKGAGLIGAVAWLIPVALAFTYVGGLISRPIWRAYFENNPLIWTPLFVMGVCAPRFIPAWNRVRRSRAAIISLAALFSVVLLAMFCPQAWVAVFVTGGIAPLLLGIVVFFSRTTGVITRVLGGAVLNKLGKASYVIYIIQAPLWHYWQMFTGFLMRHLPIAHVNAPQWQFWWFLPVLILCSLMVEQFVETPVRSWLLRLVKPGSSSSLSMQELIHRREEVAGTLRTTA